ncbi:unnamed protein product [Clonostachys chloroleuca]|uniref:JmjC domain-containing protein n=1 Tax=Clonostachys chloroleuca TaxID=1926264 RepID=A0AA35QFX0_9HYPO|nr:unnamed protein product [Clonostachys chloroleuca]
MLPFRQIRICTYMDEYFPHLRTSGKNRSQKAGEVLVTLPGTYHQGFTLGYTKAEAMNYADENSCGVIVVVPSTPSTGKIDQSKEIATVSSERPTTAT